MRHRREKHTLGGTKRKHQEPCREELLGTSVVAEMQTHNWCREKDLRGATHVIRQLTDTPKGTSRVKLCTNCLADDSFKNMSVKRLRSTNKGRLTKRRMHMDTLDL